jgi:PhzF family phenazine biosynthesis protein
VSSQRFTQVDAFTNRPFAGNPAAVCLLPSPRDSKWMQHVAQEMNLAETAFLAHLGGHAVTVLRGELLH